MARSISPGDYDSIYTLEELEYDDEAIPPPYRGLCIEEKGELRGYLLVEPREDRFVYVRALAIHPNSRNKGLGTLLIRALQASNSAILLRTEPDTPHLSRLYERLGFQVTRDPALQSPRRDITSWVWESM
jgi:ribosomal protein S18 acetylase RimI-like enzyme